MNRTTKKITIAALLTTGIASAVAVLPSYAQEAAAPAATATRFNAPHAAKRMAEHGRPGVGIAADLMEQFDTDGDGVVTQAEIDAVRAGELEEYDANGDGQLSLEEYQAYWLARMYERMVDAFQRLDANGDGQVTTAEFNEGLANIVVRLDQDGDGALGPTDRPERPADGARMGPGGQTGPGMRGPAGPGR